MRLERGLRFARGAAVGALALVIAGIAAPCRAETAARAKSQVADWPAQSRLTALALIEKYGAPRKSDAESLTWYGPGDWKKTVVHKVPSGGMISQTVADRISSAKADDVRAFDEGITIDEKKGEMTVRSDSERTNFLAANLAHDVASGFKSPRQARDDYDQTLRLAESGKSSRYLDGLRFVRIPNPANSPISPDRLDWPTPKALPDGKYTPAY